MPPTRNLPDLITTIQKMAALTITARKIPIQKIPAKMQGAKMRAAERKIPPMQITVEVLLIFILPRKTPFI